MASAKETKFGSYCDSVYRELSGMKTRLLDFAREIEQMKGPERETLNPHIQHFRDIANTIDWKLEILTKVCPLEWSGYAGEVEKTASVQVREEFEEEPVAGGYLGG